jgi:hypothetical protein
MGGETAPGKGGMHTLSTIVPENVWNLFWFNMLILLKYNILIARRAVRGGNEGVVIMYILSDNFTAVVQC